MSQGFEPRDRFENPCDTDGGPGAPMISGAIIGQGARLTLPTAPHRVEGRKRRNRRLFATTKIELNAIAAPAIIGLSRPAAASGSAATL